MKLIRRLVVQCLQFNILCKAEHIKGSLNTLSDKLSRQQITEFLRDFPHQDPVQIPVTTSTLIL